MPRVIAPRIPQSSMSENPQVARVTGLEPATSGVTGRHSNQLSYTRAATWETRH